MWTELMKDFLGIGLFALNLRRVNHFFFMIDSLLATMSLDRSHQTDSFYVASDISNLENWLYFQNKDSTTQNKNVFSFIRVFKQCILQDEWLAYVQ